MPKHGAHVLARPASDAMEDRPELGREDRRPAVVDHDHVQFLGPVGILGPARAADHVEVRAYTLPGRAPGEQGQHHGQLPKRRQDAFHAHQGDVHGR